jgi:hypothetical protein
VKTNHVYTFSQWVLLLLLPTFLVMGAAACIRDEAEKSVVEPEGPALIMFYTDG